MSPYVRDLSASYDNVLATFCISSPDADRTRGSDGTRKLPSQEAFVINNSFGGSRPQYYLGVRAADELHDCGADGLLSSD
jgi:hypothetical protein